MLIYSVFEPTSLDDCSRGSTDDAGIFAFHTVVNTNSIMWTVEYVIFIACAIHVVQDKVRSNMIWLDVVTSSRQR